MLAIASGAGTGTGRTATATLPPRHGWPRAVTALARGLPVRWQACALWNVEGSRASHWCCRHAPSSEAATGGVKATAGGAPLLLGPRAVASWPLASGPAGSLTVAPPGTVAATKLGQWRGIARRRPLPEHLVQVEVPPTSTAACRKREPQAGAPWCSGGTKRLAGCRRQHVAEAGSPAVGGGTSTCVGRWDCHRGPVGHARLGVASSPVAPATGRQPRRCRWQCRCR